MPAAISVFLTLAIGNEERTLHIKEDPEFPGYEYASRSLAYAITGEAPYQAKLALLKHGNHKKRLILLSQTVRGETEI